MTATVKSAVKKTTAKKAAAKPVETAEDARIPATDPDFGAKVVELREGQEMKWDEIATEMECQPGKAMLAYLVQTIPARQKIKGSDEDVAQKIVAARDEDQDSWGRISARANLPESRVRKIYTDTSGINSRGLRIGKGGRFPEGVERPAKAEKAPAAKKVAAAKKVPVAKKAAAKPRGNPLLKMDVDQLAKRINGKTITVDRDGSDERIKVKSVSDLSDGIVEFTDQAGKARTIEVSTITKCSR